MVKRKRTELLTNLLSLPKDIIYLIINSNPLMAIVLRSVCRQLYSYIPIVVESQLASYAAETGSMNLFQWCIEYGYPIDEETMNWAAHVGALNILEYGKELITPECARYACIGAWVRHGNIKYRTPEYIELENVIDVIKKETGLSLKEIIK